MELEYTDLDSYEPPRVQEARPLLEKPRVISAMMLGPQGITPTWLEMYTRARVWVIGQRVTL